MIYIGIDPGVGGGIAMIDDERRVLLAVPMPETDRDILDLFTIKAPAVAIADVALNRRRAVLERASSSPQMGVVSAFTYGRGFGGLRMALTAAQIPFDEVASPKWQQVMGCRSGGDKNITKRRAQQLFPERTKITHAIADALLLAEFCRRLEARP